MGKKLAPRLPLVEGKYRFNQLRHGKSLGWTEYLRRRIAIFEAKSPKNCQIAPQVFAARMGQRASNKQTLPKLVTILTGCRFWVLFCQRTQSRRVFGVMGADRALLCRSEVK
jgi:hypothetical protein